MRSILFISIAFVSLNTPLWVFVILAAIYTLFYRSYELLFLAVLMDAHFGEEGRSVWYTYTLVTSVLLIVGAFVKPHIRFYV